MEWCCRTLVDMWEFLSHRVDAEMAQCPQCVIPVRKDGWRDQWGGRKEDRDLRRADRQCPTYYRMTSSHQSPGNREGTGARDVGGGQLRMSQRRDKLWRSCWALIKHWWHTQILRNTQTQGGQNMSIALRRASVISPQNYKFKHVSASFICFSLNFVFSQIRGLF